MKYKANSGSHSIYSLQFHYIACVKYRHKIMLNKIPNRLKEINNSVAKKFGIEIIEQKIMPDHIHIVFGSKPQIQLSKFINSLKAVFGRLLFREFPDIKKYLWKNHFWSPSYFLASTGQVTLKTLKKYVENQSAKNL